MRFALRVDANQRECIDALEAEGYTVEVIGKPVDLQVGNKTTGKVMLMEIKVKGGKKTSFQVGYFDRWAGYEAVSLVDGPEAAVRHAKLVLGAV